MPLTFCFLWIHLGIIAAVNETYNEYDVDTYDDMAEINLDWLVGLLDDIGDKSNTLNVFYCVIKREKLFIRL